jgi:hypothetical protein
MSEGWPRAGAPKTRTAERASNAMYTSRSVLPDQQASGAPIDNDRFLYRRIKCGAMPVAIISERTAARRPLA